MKKRFAILMASLIGSITFFWGCDFTPPNSGGGHPTVTYQVEYENAYLQLEVGQSFSPELIFKANDEDQDVSALTFFSDNTDCVTVNSSGLITAVGEGITNVTAEIGTGENLVCDNIVVSVSTNVVPEDNCEIRYSSRCIEMQVGEKLTPALTYTVNNQAQNAYQLSYSSDNGYCATVASGGEVTAVSAGYAVIKASKWTGATLVYDQIVIIVLDGTEGTPSQPATEVYQVDYANAYIELEVGQSVTPVIAYLLNGVNQNASALSYSTDNSACATVSSNGCVTAVSAGYATITASIWTGSTTVSDKIAIVVKESSVTSSYVVTKGSNGADFIIDYPSGKDISVLQITDTQTIDYYGMRNTTRQNQIRNAFFSNNMSKDYNVRAWRYVDEAVERSKPDLIIATGDNIYGETDDDGEQWEDFISVMDSYEVPWLTVFGNHDNESAKGVNWQIEKLMESEYCVFERGTVTGNSNYTVLISSGGAAKYLFVMMDTNGCREIPENPGEGILSTNKDLAYIRQNAGLADDQIAWLENSVNSAYGHYGNVPMIVWQHVAVAEAWNAMRDLYGISESSQISASNLFNLYDPTNPHFKKHPENFGIAATLATTSYTYVERLWPLLKNLGCKGMFFGHEHDIATSIVYGGIRLTYGLKTGTYAYHDKNILGATKVTLDVSEKTFGVEHLFSHYDYDTNKA